MGHDQFIWSLFSRDGELMRESVGFGVPGARAVGEGIAVATQE